MYKTVRNSPSFPPSPSSPFLFVLVALYLLYAKLEEEHGLSRHAMAIYDRATKAVPAEEQFEVCRYLSVKFKF
jgi:hypothetical protein